MGTEGDGMASDLYMAYMASDGVHGGRQSAVRVHRSRTCAYACTGLGPVHTRAQVCRVFLNKQLSATPRQPLSTLDARLHLCLDQDTCLCHQGIESHQGIEKETCTHAWWNCRGQLPCALFGLLLAHTRPLGTNSIRV